MKIVSLGQEIETALEVEYPSTDFAGLIHDSMLQAKLADLSKEQFAIIHGFMATAYNIAYKKHAL